MGEVGWQKRGLLMDTKLYPNVVSLWPSSGLGRISLRFAVQSNARLRAPGKTVISHSSEDLRKYLDISLKALKAEYAVRST